jgi:DNA-binding CsgD family transcriptional regulator
MLRTVLIHGAFLAAGTLGLQWLQSRFLMYAYPGEAFAGLVALAFLALGLWAGSRLSGQAPPVTAEPVSRASPAAGVSSRELQVLQLLAAGQSNKEMARQLGVSPNTIKTHVARLFEKLKARRRTEAIARARELGMLP